MVNLINISFSVFLLSFTYALDPGSGILIIYYESMSGVPYSWAPSETYIHYMTGFGWTVSPVLMQPSTNSSYPSDQWAEYSLYANSLQFVFTNGDEWDNNNQDDYVYGYPGIITISEMNIETILKLDPNCPGQPMCGGHGHCGNGYLCVCDTDLWVTYKGPECKEKIKNNGLIFGLTGGVIFVIILISGFVIYWTKTQKRTNTITDTRKSAWMFGYSWGGKRDTNRSTIKQKAIEQKEQNKFNLAKDLDEALKNDEKNTTDELVWDRFLQNLNTKGMSIDDLHPRSIPELMIELNKLSSLTSTEKEIISRQFFTRMARTTLN